MHFLTKHVDKTIMPSVDDLKSALISYGLDETRASAYLALLTLGKGSAHEVARASGIKRTTCYAALDALERDGLVSRARFGKKRMFIAEQPSRLEESLLKRLASMRMTIPRLIHMYEARSAKPRISVFEGVDGVWNAYHDVLQHRNEVLAFIPTEMEAEILGFEKIAEYVRERTRLRIPMKAIMPKTRGVLERYASHSKEQLRSVRFVDPNKFPFSVEINIYGANKVAIISVRDSVGVIIESKEIQNTMRSIFRSLWKSLPS